MHSKCGFEAKTRIHPHFAILWTELPVGDGLNLDIAVKFMFHKTRQVNSI